MRISTFVCIVVLVLKFDILVAAKCERKPEGTLTNRTPFDGRFKLRILGDPDRFIPGQNYTSN
jgi:spondin-1